MTTDAKMRKALDDAQHRHEWAQEQAAEFQAARNVAVHQAIADGWTHAQIARATGLTRSRIGAIAQNQQIRGRNK